MASVGPAFARYPIPEGASRQPQYERWFTQLKPDGRPYSDGRRHGTRRWEPMHGACDVLVSRPGAYGENVYPVLGGVVVGVRSPGGASYGITWGSAYGGQVLIRHRYRKRSGIVVVRWSFYAHLDNLPDTPRHMINEAVTHRDRIGDASGTTTRGATPFPPHLHWAWQSTPRHKDGVISAAKLLEAARLKVA